MSYLVLLIDIDTLEGNDLDNLKVYTMFCLYLYLYMHPL